MKTLIILAALTLILTAAPVRANTFADTPVEVVAIKDAGISDADESKSIIEVRWRTNPAINASASIFKLQLSVTYADGSTLMLTQNADGEAMYAQFEVPSARLSKRHPPALIKRISAVVIAVLPKQPN